MVLAVVHDWVAVMPVDGSLSVQIALPENELFFDRCEFLAVLCRRAGT
jgi:hypothetical protein